MSRASVSSQRHPHPLLLKTAHSSMSSEGSARSKRDSVLASSLHRSSWKPPSTLQEQLETQRPSSAAADVGSNNNTAMAPVYRLYPNQAAEGRRSLRSPKSRELSRVGFDTASLNAPHSSYNSVSGDSSFDRDSQDIDYRFERQSSRLSHQTSTPDFFEFDETSSQAAGPRRSSMQDDDGHITSSAQRLQSYRSRRTPAVRRPSGSVVSMSDTHETGTERGYGGAGDRSSAGSTFSQETAATSVQTLPALQTKGPDNSDAQQLEPVLEDDPRSWDLVAPADGEGATGIYELEKRAEQLFSSEHLRTIFDDPKMLLKFTGFLNTHRPASIPILIYYLDALKALRAINYANAIADALAPLKGHGFTHDTADTTINARLEEKADQAFEILVRDELPVYIAHTWVSMVSISIQRRILGTMAPHLREASEGLAEVFCLTDPSRTDNPIVFASEEFARTTQYGMSYTIGRNCRFLQGPRTNPYSVRRLADAISSGKEHTEILVNYRRDGSPFLNLLMMAPLMDSRGNIRYFIGAQVDVSGLLKDCNSMDGLLKMVEREQREEAGEEIEESNDKDPFQELSEMFNGAELDTVRRSGGRMHKEYVDESDRDSIIGGRPRLLLKDPSQDLLDKQREQSIANGPAQSIRERLNGKLDGIYQHYLLIRPAPSLRILFTSPSLRVPGILQSPFLHRIGGSSRVRADLAAALAEGRGVTAKIRWLLRADADGAGDGRPRWIHCTPLLGHSGAVGVWMVVLVEESEGGSATATANRRLRTAPPVATVIGGKEWDGNARRQASGATAITTARQSGATVDELAENQKLRLPESRSASALGAHHPERLVSSRQETLLHEDALVPPGTSGQDASEFSFQLK